MPYVLGGEYVLLSPHHALYVRREIVIFPDGQTGLVFLYRADVPKAVFCAELRVPVLLQE